ncbi:MAG: hypothetical protein KJ792_04830 [Actinobacteria bacterium]|nr:hypothetical protein [Actinomycetota bacterium]MCG2801831.1 hypothetical protein [Cellulomonas sp.]
MDPLPGWEAFTVDLRADLVNDEPRLTGMRLEPRAGVPLADAVLTSNRLRAFPAGAFAAAVYHLTHLRPDRMPDAVDALRATAETLARHGRRIASTEQVARTYTLARRAGKAPRAAVCEELRISTRTADRYISEARRLGLLAPYNERKARTSDGEQQGS